MITQRPWYRIGQPASLDCTLVVHFQSERAIQPTNAHPRLMGWITIRLATRPCSRPCSPPTSSRNRATRCVQRGPRNRGNWPTMLIMLHQPWWRALAWTHRIVTTPGR